MHKNTKAALIAAFLVATPAAAMAQSDPLENLSPVGKDSYALYMKLDGPKAFALADDGSIGYSSAADGATARANALSRCAEVTNEQCRIFSVDGQVTAANAGGELRQIANTNTDAIDLKGEVLADYEKAEGAKALAMSTDGAFGWVVRENEEEARRAALTECQTYGSDCTIQSSQPAATN